MFLIRYIILFVVVVIVILLMPLPKQKQENADILYLNPYMSKFMVPIGNQILADKFWLLSHNIDETHYKNSHKVNLDNFFIVSKNIILLEPYFYEAVNYPSTYFASVYNDINRSIALLKVSRAYDKKNFFLYYNEILFHILYNKSINQEFIISLIKRLYLIDSNKKYLHGIRVDDLIYDMLISLRKNKKSKIKDDLQWLLTNTQNRAKRQEIKMLLKKYTTKN